MSNVPLARSDSYSNLSSVLQWTQVQCAQLVL